MDVRLSCSSPRSLLGVEDILNSIVPPLIKSSYFINVLSYFSPLTYILSTYTFSLLLLFALITSFLFPSKLTVTSLNCGEPIANSSFPIDNG